MSTFFEASGDFGAFAERIVAPARVFDAARGGEIAALVSPPAGAVRLVEAAAGGAPFLARLMRREAEWTSGLWGRSPEAALAELMAAAAGAAAEGEKPLRLALRVARRRTALLTALADLGGVWDLDQVTGALTAFAEFACRTTLDFLLAEEARQGQIEGFDPARPGYVLLAMGKMGAGELNYSSDIDLIALFDQDRLPEKSLGTAKTRFVRLTQRLARILADVDGDGYVARVDLRLRPDPQATQVCLAMETAERYYELMGRTWERAAHIKARPVAGDLEAGAAYLKRLSPFIWRRHLDFAALADAADMLARIRAHEGGAEIAVAGQDVKLGAGGIREIEFLAQTQQLILGGRDPGLRTPRTIEALQALAARGLISETDLETLQAAYPKLRSLEHRLQMVEDQQTHRIPTSQDGLERIAALCGAADVARFEAETRAVMSSVRRIASPSLDTPAPAAAPSLSAAAESLPEPERARQIAENWFSGRLRAVRSQRARESLERLAPQILRSLSAAPDPMKSLIRFDRFLSGLPSGVQLLAMFEANPKLLDLLTEICAAAPRLADLLAARSNLLDAVLDGDFFARPPDLEGLRADLDARLALEAARSGGDYERALDATRRWSRELRFQIGVGLLRGVLAADEAGRLFSNVAEACVGALWPLVEAELTRRYGPPPGRGAALMALGKLGSREMTATSDLDLILVYDAELADQSEGPRSLAAPQYYARFTQTLTNALSSPTSEGALYEVDMRLRPSGRSGPLATALTAFRRYQREDAWIWEHMALTRARVIAGPKPVREAVRGAVAEALAKHRDPEAIRRAAYEMRGKLAAAFPAPAGRLWTLQHGAGGMLDLEFVAQSGVLIAGVAAEGALSTANAFARLAAAGALDDAEAAALAEAHRLQIGLLQIERMAVDAPLTEVEAPLALRGALAAVAGLPAEAGSFEALEAQLSEARTLARAAFERWFAAAAAHAAAKEAEA